MIRHRRIVSCIAILALLLGNFAGWMHVNQHVGSVASANEVHTESIEPAESGCCHTSCCSSPSSSEAGSGGEACGAGDEDPVQPHDPSDCATCQKFFTLRSAAFSAPAAVIVTRVDVPAPIVWVDQDDVVSEFIRAKVHRRGPPLV